MLVTAAAIFIVLGASALLMALERNPFAVAAVLVMLWISVDAGIRSWRAGGSRLLIGSIAGFWLLSAARGARRALGGLVLARRAGTRHTSR